MANVHYESSSTGYRLGYRAITQSGEHAAQSELAYVRKRAMYLSRNNGFAKAALLNNAAHAVGNGIRGKWSNKALQKHWVEFTQNPTPDGRGDFFSLQKLLANAVFLDGEVFFQKKVFTKYGKTVPFYVQPIEADYLSLAETVNGVAPIEYDAVTFRATKYNFYKRRPPDNPGSKYRYETVAVPAKDVVHTVERSLFSDIRGAPKLAPVIVSLLNIEDVIDPTIVRQKAAQAVAWVIKKSSSRDINPFGTPSVAVKTAPTEPDRIITEVDAGGIHYLAEDEDLIQTDPPDIGGNLIVLLELLLRQSAAGCGLTYEMLTGDLTNVNYSSIRAGMLDFRKRIEQLQNLTIIGEGLLPIAMMFKTFCSAWTNTDYSEERIKWYLPKKEGIDALKDIKADILSLEGDLPLTSLKAIIESYGYDWQDYLTELQETRDEIFKITRPTESTDVTSPNKAGDGE